MTNLKITDKFKDSLYPILTFLAIIIVWQAVVEIKYIPQYILPTPIDIIKEIPVNKLLAETDGPTALQWVNGVYGMPDEIKNVYENICIIKKLDIEEFKLNSQTIMTNIMKNK